MIHKWQSIEEWGRLPVAYALSLVCVVFTMVSTLIGNDAKHDAHAYSCVFLVVSFHTNTPIAKSLLPDIQDFDFHRCCEFLGLGFPTLYILYSLEITPPPPFC